MKNKNFLIGGVVAIFIIGGGFMIGSDSISLDDFLRSMSRMNPRLLSVAVLPLIVALFFLGRYLHRKSVERKWKNALLQTRAKQQEEAARKAAGNKEH